MATYIQGINCAAGCTTDPCGCDFGVGSDLPGFDTTFDVTGQFDADHDVDIEVFDYAACDTPVGRDLSYRVRIDADGSSIYDSGCVTSSSISTSATVPAGTTSLRIRTEVDCSSPCESGGGGSWTVTCV